MDLDQFTYGQLDGLLMKLGFTRAQVQSQWLVYQHAPSDTLIALVEKEPEQMVRITDAVGARRHLIDKGLISEKEFKAFLMQTGVSKKAV